MSQPASSMQTCYIPASSQSISHTVAPELSIPDIHVHLGKENRPFILTLLGSRIYWRMIPAPGHSDPEIQTPEL